MPGSRGAAVGFAASGLALTVMLALHTPWHTIGTPAGGATPVDAARDFTPAQIARESAFHAALRPNAFTALLLSVLVAAVLGFTPLGARMIAAVAQPFGGGWVAQVLLGGALLAVIGRLATLPSAAYSEMVLRRYGLSTQSWGSWAVDAAKAFALSTAITVGVLLALYAVVRAAPRSWWLWAAGGGAALVLVASFAYPIVVEPLFNRFTPMPAGPMRTSLLELARADGVPVRDVLVADASRRTTALNAYVSGFGATRRIVVYDTLLRTATPEEVRLVVAHELGHAKRNDVLYGTIAGALAVATAICGAALLLRWRWLLERGGVTGIADPRSLALLLAVFTVASLAVSPITQLVSRRIEARADVHSLELTRDPAGFVAMQRQLAVTNLSELEPNPIVYALFASHPTAPQRIAVARDWARLHRVAVP